MLRDEHIRARFAGALLGTFVGDALGMPVEGQTRESIAHRHGVITELLPGRLATGCHTDDTQMAMAVAESLVARRRFDHAATASRLLAAADPARGYGTGMTEVLQRLGDGEPWAEAARRIYGQGSFGNGAAVRVAPVGLLYHRDLRTCAATARASAEITHAHPLGKAGAAVQALGVALALRWSTEEAGPIDPDYVLAIIETYLEDHEGLFGECLQKVAMVLASRSAAPLGAAMDERRAWATKVADVLGTDARAFQSVPTALYLLLAYPDSFEAALVGAVSLGGDTDSIAAMTGALAGAYHGVEAIPDRWLEGLERGPRGRDYVAGLADDLFLVWLESQSDCPLSPDGLRGRRYRA